MTQEQELRIKSLREHPDWSVFLDVAEEMIQNEDRISTLPKFTSATALQKHLEAKQLAFQMFRGLIDSLDYTQNIKLYKPEGVSKYKTLQEEG